MFEEMTRAVIKKGQAHHFARRFTAMLLAASLTWSMSGFTLAAQDDVSSATPANGTGVSEQVLDSGAPAQVTLSDMVALVNGLRDLTLTDKAAVLEKQDAIQALKDAYAALSTADRVAFNESAEKSRYDELIEALAGFLREDRPELTSDDVGALLDALAGVNLSDRVELLAAKDKLTAALKAYEKLPEGEKRLFTEAQAAFVQKLSDALKAYYEKPATASEIAELIARLAAAADAGEIPDADAVKAARAAYDALTDEEKAAFDADTLAMLVMLEAALLATPMTSTNVAAIGDVEYATLEAAVTAAQADDKIQMLADDPAFQQIIILKSLAIELNGFNLPSTSFKINAGTVSISDRNGKGKIGESLSSGDGITIDGATVTLNNVRVFSGAGLAKAIRLTSGSLTVNGGVYTGQGYNGSDAIFVEKGNLTINDGVFKSTDYGCGLSYSGTPTGLKIKKGTFIAGGNQGAFWLGFVSAITTKEQVETTFLSGSPGSFVVLANGAAFDKDHVVIGSNLFVSDGFDAPENGSTDVSNPAVLTPAPGDSVTLAPQILGGNGDASTLEYQWNKDDAPLAGETAPTHTIDSYDPATDDGAYSVTVTDPALPDASINIYWELSAPAPADAITVTISDGTKTGTGGGATLKAAVDAAVTASGVTASSITALKITAGTVTENDWKALKTLTALTDFEIANDDAVISVAAIPSGTNGNAVFPKSITTVTLPKTTSVGERAFSGCEALTTVTLSAAKTISTSAFSGCAELATITLPAAETIGENAFFKCTALTSVSLPAATNIVGFAFNGCAALTTAKLPKTTYIGEKAFVDCTKLATLTLGADVPTVPNRSAFDGCPATRNLTLVGADGITPLKGDALTAAQAAYDKATDYMSGSTTTDGLWFGWTLPEPVADPVASWAVTGGGTGEGTLTEALAAVKASGGTITLLANVEDTHNPLMVTISGFSNPVTLVLNGKTLHADVIFEEVRGLFTIDGTAEGSKIQGATSAAIYSDGNNIELKGGTYIGDSDESEKAPAIAMEVPANEPEEVGKLYTLLAEGYTFADKTGFEIIPAGSNNGLACTGNRVEVTVAREASWTSADGNTTATGTLKAAHNLAKKSGGTVTLLTDAEVRDENNGYIDTLMIDHTFEKAVTLVLNGHTLTGGIGLMGNTGLFTIDGSKDGSTVKSSYSYAITSLSGAQLKLKGGTYTCSKIESMEPYAIMLIGATSVDALYDLLADGYMFESEEGFGVLAEDGDSAAITGQTVKVVPTDNITITVAMGTEIRANVGSTNLTNAVLKSELPQTEITELTITAGKVTGADWAYLADNVNVKLRKLTDFTISASIPDSNVADIPDVSQYKEGFSSTLENVTIPQKIQIGKEVFLDCRNLTQVNIPKATKIGESAFSRCRALESVSFPEVTAISENAFSGCSKLAAASFPKATTIGNYAFLGCSELASLTLGKEPPQVAAFTTFSSCPDLRTLTITGVTGDALAAAQANYKAANDGDKTDDLWYGWTIGGSSVNVPAPGGKLEAPLTQDKVDGVFGAGNATLDNTSNPPKITLDNSITAEAPIEIETNVTIDLGGNTIIGKPGEPPIIVGDGTNVTVDGSGTVSGGDNPGGTGGNGITGGNGGSITIGGGVTVEGGDGGAGGDGIQSGGNVTVDGTVSGGNGSSGNGGDGVDTSGGSGNITVAPGGSSSGGSSTGGNGNGGDGTNAGGYTDIGGDATGGSGSGSGSGGSGATNDANSSGSITVQPGGSASGGSGGSGGGNGGDGVNDAGGGSIIVDGNATGGNGGSGSSAGGNGGNGTSTDGGATIINPGGNVTGGDGGSASSGTGGTGGSGSTSTGNGNIQVDGGANGGNGGSGSTGGNGGNGTTTDSGATVIKPDGSAAGGNGGSASSGAGGAGGSGSTSTGGGNIAVDGNTAGGAGGNGATGGNGGNGTSTGGGTVVNGGGSASGGTGGNGSTAGGNGGNGTDTSGTNTAVNGNATGGNGGSGTPGTNGNGGNGGNGANQGGGLVNGSGTVTGGNGGSGAGTGSGGSGGNGVGSGDTQAGDNLTVINGKTLKVEITGNPGTTVTIPNAGAAADAVLTDAEKADPDISDVKVTLKVDDKTADKPIDAEKAEAVKPANSVIGAFFDITLQKTITKNNVAGSPEAVTSVPNGVITITIEIPSAMRGGSDYVVIRVHDGNATQLDTTQTGNELTFATDKFSTYAIAYTKGVTPPPSDNTGGGSSDSGSSGGTGGARGSLLDDKQYQFWMNVKDRIDKASNGDVIKVNARGYDRMPKSVLEALRKNAGVSLIITWNGKTVTIPAGKAQSNETGRIYWPLSKLAELYAEITEDAVLKPADSETGDPGKLIPITGGGVLITLDAPAPAPMMENALPESAESVQATAPVLPATITPPDAGFETDAFAGTPDNPTKSGGSSTAQWVVLAMLVTAGAIGGVWFWKRRKEEIK